MAELTSNKTAIIEWHNAKDEKPNGGRQTLLVCSSMGVVTTTTWGNDVFYRYKKGETRVVYWAYLPSPPAEIKKNTCPSCGAKYRTMMHNPVPNFCANCGAKIKEEDK